MGHGNKAKNRLVFLSIFWCIWFLLFMNEISCVNTVGFSYSFRVDVGISLKISDMDDEVMSDIDDEVMIACALILIRNKGCTECN